MVRNTKASGGPGKSPPVRDLGEKQEEECNPLPSSGQDSPGQNVNSQTLWRMVELNI